MRWDQGATFHSLVCVCVPVHRYDCVFLFVCVCVCWCIINVPPIDKQHVLGVIALKSRILKSRANAWLCVRVRVCYLRERNVKMAEIFSSQSKQRLCPSSHRNLPCIFICRVMLDTALKNDETAALMSSD